MISSVSSSLSLSLGQGPFILNSAFARLADIGASRGSTVYTTVISLQRAQSYRCVLLTLTLTWALGFEAHALMHVR